LASLREIFFMFALRQW